MGALAFLVSGLFFIPIFYRLQPISIYEYFEHRFGSKLMRKAAAGIFLVYALFYMAVVLYSPAIALAGVTGTGTWPWILIIGLVCTTYTTIGGLKAVVWTDTIQAVFMYLGVGVMIVKGTMDSGGWHRVWQVAGDLGRLKPLTNWDINPLQHNSMWVSTFGAFGFWMVQYGLNQMAIQRYCSLPSLKQTRFVIFLTVPCFAILGSTACFIGIVMLAFFYGDCDPLDRAAMGLDGGYKADQLVIVFAVRTLRSVPGLPGLFLACLFSSTLSTFSSGMNSQAAVLWEDFLKEHLGHRVNDDRAASINKLLVCAFGMAATAMAFAAEPIGGIMKASFSILGAISGPLVGLFFLGVFVPRAHCRTSLVALVIAACCNVFLAVGNILHSPYAHYRMPANDTCYDYQGKSSWTDKRNVELSGYGNANVFWPFRISTYLYPVFGITIVLVIGTILSYLINDKQAKSEETKDKQISLTFYGQWKGYKIDDGHSYPRIPSSLAVPEHSTKPQEMFY